MLNLCFVGKWSDLHEPLGNISKGKENLDLIFI